MRAASSVRATVICTVDLLLFAVSIGGVVLSANSAVKVLWGLVARLAIARLFVIGHDACHQAFFAERRTNRWIGRLVFLPSLTNYSLWEAGHNLGHHVYTNLRGYDRVWTPHTKAEYDAMPRWRRALERVYRSPFGHGLYYLVELWWKTLLYPTPEQRARPGGAFLRDSLLVAGFAVAWIGGLVLAALTTAQSPALLVSCGFLLPLALWKVTMGSVIYFHHTHPDVAWFEDIDLWQVERDSVASTVLITFPYRLGAFLNNIMQHPAHHLDVRIPLYNIDAAQATLNAQPSRTVVQPFGPAHVANCISRCKLYDYEARRWTDFDGNFTSLPAPLTAQREPASA